MDEFIERRILIGLIVSTDYHQRIQRFWNDGLLESTEIRRVAGWCFDFYQRYGRAPGQAIQDLYMAALKADQIPKGEAEYIEQVLARLSNEYERAEQFNSAYLYDQTVQYFRQRRLQRHNEQVQTLIEQGQVAEAEEAQQSFAPLTLEDEETGHVRGDAVELKRIKWLWPTWIPLGKVTVLAGNPGVGKSLITLDIAARVTKGAELPAANGVNATTGQVVIISGEDDKADTIVPRFLAAGGNPKRLHVLEGVPARDKHGKPYLRPWTLKEIGYLRRVLEKEVRHCRLVIIDPISAFMAGTDAHKNADVRGLLLPVAKLAADTGAAILVVTHLRKGEGAAWEKVVGSLALVAAARVGIVVAKDQSDPHRRIVAPIKNNLAPEMGALSYYIDENENGQPVVLWQDRMVEVDVDDLVTRKDPEQLSLAEEVKDWLREELSEGPVEVSTIFKRGKEFSYSKDQLRRARVQIGARYRRVGFGQGGYIEWHLRGHPRRPMFSMPFRQSMQSMQSMGDPTDQRKAKRLRRPTLGMLSKKVSVNARQQRKRVEGAKDEGPE